MAQEEVQGPLSSVAASASASASDASSSAAARRKVVLMGTCGWSDHTLLKCGRFYPASVRSTEDRLRHYSNYFPCVEVDTSTYAIPSIPSVKSWLYCVPKGFLFHFKAFGLFCSKSCPLASLPVHIRSKVSLECPEQDYIHLNGMSDTIRNELWDIFNSTLHIAYSTGNLGVIVFQFHLNFNHSKENQTHVEWCRENLDPSYSMAVEFRCRDWFNGQHFVSTTEWLEKWGIALVAADELLHETFQKDKQQIGLSKGQNRVILPVAWALTQPKFMYIRLHRREGAQRLLSESELLIWASRLKDDIPSKLKGPIYFMWGTDWEDQPIINAKRLSDKLADMAFNWKMFRQCSNKGLDSYFGSKSQMNCHVASREPFSTFSGKRQVSTRDDKSDSVALNETPVEQSAESTWDDKSDLMMLNETHVEKKSAGVVVPLPKKSAKREGNKLKTMLTIHKYFQKSI